MGFFRRYRDTFIVVLLLFVPFFFLRASIRRPEEHNALDRALMGAMAPIQYFAGAVARGISDLVGKYVYLKDVGQDNDRLSREVSRLEHDVRELSRIQQENEKLRKLLSLKESLPVTTVSAAVTTKTTSEFFRVMHVVVDHQGAPIRQNMPVIADGGAVGLVRTVVGDSATIQLVADAGFGVDVVSSRTGARGFVRGVGDEKNYAVKVEYFQRADEVEVGDVLVTSGVGCRFPSGIVVAKVTRVVRREFGSYQQVEAEPTVDFSRLGEVLIVTSVPADCETPKGKGR